MDNTTQHEGDATGAPAADALSVIEPTIAAKLLIAGNFWRRAGNAYYQALYGLSITEVHALALLEKTAPQSLTAISDECGIDKTQMSRALKRLVERGLVVHNKSGRAGAPRGLSLGPEGIAIRPALRRAASRREHALVAGLTPAETAELARLLDIVVGNVRSAGVHP